MNRQNSFSMIFKCFILFALIEILSLTSASSFKDDEEKLLPHFNKRSRRSHDIIDEDLPPVTHDFIANDPILRFCYENIPRMSRRELSGMFDEAINNENFGLIKVMSLKVNFDEMVHSDQIESLCRSQSEVSLNILDFVLDKIRLTDEFIDENLVNWLNCCVPFGFKKFQLFWEAFNCGETLPIISLAGVLTEISSYESMDFYKFVLEKIGGFKSEKFIIILIKAVVRCIMFRNSDVINFLLENGLSLSILDLSHKIKIVIMATNTNNLSLLNFLLGDNEVLSNLRVMEISPWIMAVQRDHPEIVDAYIKAIPMINKENLIMTAFSHKSRQVLKYFKTIVILTDEILFKMAVAAIKSKNLDAMKFLYHVGIPIEASDSNGWNLLTISVDQDAIRIVEFLIRTCGMNPNGINGKHDTEVTLTSFTPIYYAKSPEMVRLLSKTGAEVNAKFEIFALNGVIIKSTTALHKAASESNLKMFTALMKNGADMTIADDAGITNESFWYGILSSDYPEEFE